MFPGNLFSLYSVVEHSCTSSYSCVQIALDADSHKKVAKFCKVEISFVE